jgi:uncharacterized alpha-E superfamily protein
VAGLAECARSGSVLIANALGSGALESGALLGFLPQLCERLLGQELKLPSIATWWCGEPAALRDALAQADRLVFKPTERSNAFDVIFGKDLDAAGLADLRAKLMANPEKFVAQELVHVSQAPVLSRSAQVDLEPRCVGLRVFAVATSAGYTVMPGGLTRVANSAHARVVSMQRGGASKDTWVLSPGQVDTSFTLLRSTVTAADLVRSPAGLPSRLAENLYWFGRHAERCDDSARLLRLALGLKLQENEDDESAYQPIHELATETGLIAASDDVDRSLLLAAVDDEEDNGLLHRLRSLQQVAFHLRERMSHDNWRVLNGLLQDCPDPAGHDVTEALEWLDIVIARLMTLSGFALDGMTRDHAWRFMSIGRRLERLQFQCASLQCAFAYDGKAGLSWLLRLSDSIVTYRARYHASPEWLPVLDLVVVDSSNPRSLLFQACGVLDYIEVLESNYGPCGADLLRPHVRFLESIDQARDLNPESRALRDAIAGLRGGVLELNDLLTRRFFNLRQASTWSSFRS